MDNIKIIKEWTDDNYSEISVSCINDKIQITETYYVDNEKIKALKDGLNKIVEESFPESYYWESAKALPNQAPVFSLTIKRYDKTGHFTVDIYMEIDNTIASCKTNHCYCSLLLETNQIDDIVKCIN